MDKFIPTDEEWEKMQKHIKGDKYKKEDFFVFETLAVGDKIVPNRYMRLTPELLMTMKEDAEKGVSLMLNHNWSQSGVQSIPIGKVFDARIAGGTQDGEETTLYTKQYILRDDSKVDGYSKNDIINLIESGILADTSVGWGTTREAYKCSICGNSIYDYENCHHYPGEKYVVNKETNEVKECIIEAHSPKEKHAGNNVLMENSIVFDGAYPNAIIQSAVGEEIETPNGNLKRLEGKQELNKNDIILGYSTAGGNINLLYKPTLKKGGLEDMNLNQKGNEEDITNKTPETNNLNNESVTEPVVEPTEKPTEKQEEKPEEKLAKEPVVEPTEENKMSVEDVLNKFDNIASNMDELIILAKEGLENRKETIAEALESGVHSMGNAFNKEVFEKTFANMSTKDIEAMGKVWETEASQKFSKEKISKQEISNKEVKEKYSNINFDNFKTALY